MPSSTTTEKEPILDYTNWADWSEYWRDHLAALDLWHFTDPDAQDILPQPNSTANREIIKQGKENFTKLRQHVSKECRKLLSGQTTLRNVWIALRAGCDRGTVLPLIAKVEAFYNHKWEAKDTISSYTSRLRDLYLSLENTDQQINRDLAVHFLIDRLPDCYKSEGQAAKQQNLPFVATTAYLLANIKDNSTNGDNTTGQALVVRERQPRQNVAKRFGRKSNRGGRQSTGRISRSGDITCNWCKHRGRTKQRQISSGEARVSKYSTAYIANPNIARPNTYPSQFPTNMQYPQYPPA